MDAAKIQLSPEEKQLVLDGGWILTKNRILTKVNSLLLEVLELQREWLKSDTVILPAEVMIPTPKISKGENYRGLPYLILDYPRLFNRGDVCAIRTFFWWGNFFSTTLHLSGEFRLKYEPEIVTAYEQLVNLGFLVAINNSPWEHHLEQDNYRRIDSMSRHEFTGIITMHSFIKITGITPLDQWELAPAKLFDNFKVLTTLLRG